MNATIAAAVLVLLATTALAGRPAVKREAEEDWGKLYPSATRQ